MLMSRRACLLAVMIGSASIVVLASVRLDAQEPSGGQSVVAKKAYDPSRRVPAFFGQIGLSQDQKEEIYKTRAKYLEKIAILQKQIDEIKVEEMKECESKLSESQKLLLNVRRRAAAEAKQAKAAVRAEAQPIAKTPTTPKSEK